MAWSPSSKLMLGRSPAGPAMLSASSREHIASAARLGSGPALGPQICRPVAERWMEEH